MIKIFQYTPKSLFLSMLFILCAGTTLHAQYFMSGEVNVNQSLSYNYTVMSNDLTNGDIVFVSWSVDGGTVISQSIGPFTPQNLIKATIQWTDTGTGNITATLYNSTLTNPDVVELTVNINSVLSTPTTPTIQSANCGNTVLVRGNPPSGVTWYWQSSASGTSTSNSSTTITRYEGTTYYLRARNSSGIWSTNSSSINYTIKQTPSVPDIPLITNNCGNTVLTKGNSPNGITWYWQNSASDTSTSNSSTSVARNSGTVYYLRARNNTNGCWSSARSISYSINTVPNTPSAPTITNNCNGSTVLTKGNSPNGVTWFWQSSASGTSRSNSSSSVTRTSGTVYYLRARNNTNGCWSTARSINYGVGTAPNTPGAPIVTNNCGSTQLSASPPPSGVTHYWQNTSTGTSTSTSAIVTFTSSGIGIYYIRARDNATGCWSTARTVNYTVNSVPDIPTAPTITNNCGNTVLTKGDSHSSITWYWQDSATGTSRSNSNPTVTFTSGTLYYLRARNKNTGCWSVARTINYVVNIVPETPSAPTITNNCGNTVLTKGSSPSGVTWFWQNSASGVSRSNSDPSLTLTSGTVYYLRAKSNTSECWSSARMINYTISQVPTWYADTDNDGFGDPNTVLQQCTQPAGYVNNPNDKCPEEPGEQQGCVFALHELTLSDENYVFTRVYQEEMSSSNQIKYNKDVIESITYFDGLGRPKQQIGIKASPNEKDIVTHIGYDDFGRQDKEWLPYHETNGSVGAYRGDKATDTKQYYQTNYASDFTDMVLADINAYSQKDLEASPLSRVLEQAAPGKDWKLGNNNEIEFEYKANVVNEVNKYYITFINNNSEVPQLAIGPPYMTGELYKTITKDENHDGTASKNHTTEEFINKQGQVILKRTYADTDTNNDGTVETEVSHDTYYVYDDYGNLTYVIPPKVTLSATDGVSPEELSELCYQYKYDYRNRLVEKKIPGKGIESIVYDNLDRPVLTQDANQAAKSPKEWLFTKYDAFSRVAYTGILTDTRDRLVMQTEISAYTDQLWVERTAENTIGGASIFYNDQGWPNLNNAEILTVQYYDDYELPPLMQSLNLVDNPAIYDVPLELNVKGLPTLSMTKVLTTDKWILSGIGYDKKGREIGLITRNNYLEYTDVIEMKLDFAGKVLESTTSHYNFYKPRIKTVDVFTYDHMGRLLKQAQKINDQDEELIAENSYDPLGQLISKKVGGTSTTLSASGLQDVNYQYNVRGWLKSINEGTTTNGDLFGFALYYTTGTNPLYNGNISKTSWQTANDNVARSYAYTYDALNRITSGITNMPDQAYSLKDVKYDMRGNIKSLYRRGPQIQGSNAAVDIDILDYTYDQGNKLQSVTDNAPPSYGGFEDGNKTSNDYTYDDNGNMTVDKNKGITSITYNHLNLPETISINNSEGTGDITYIYDATGAKLKKTAPGGGSLIEMKYAGNYIYKNGNLEFFNHPEGYVEPNGTDGFDYVYQLKDHLGNIRLSFSDKNKDGDIDVIPGSAASEILQEKNYYPFGLQHKGYNNTIVSEHNYGFGGKEEQVELGLSLMDFGARSYDPAIARWTSVDPVTHFNMSTYTAFDNNPVYFADPSGTTTVTSITDAWNATPDGENSTWNSDGNGGFCDDCQEGQTRPEMRDGKGGFRETGGQEYYHGGGGGKWGNASARWYSESEYFELFRPQIRAIGQGRASIESLHKYGFTDDVLTAMVGWALQAYDYYGGETPLARGNVNAMGVDSPVFMLASLRIVGALFLKSNSVVTNGVNVASKNMIFTAAEKTALKTATGYSRSRIVNGQGIISQFGKYDEITHTQVKLIMEAFKRNGATSIKIYTNSANPAMKNLLIPRMKSGRGLFGLDIKKRIGPGYILSGKL